MEIQGYVSPNQPYFVYTLFIKSILAPISNHLGKEMTTIGG